MDIKADRPSAESGKQYHLETGPGDLAERCLLVGSPERAAMIAGTLFDAGSARLVGDHRGLRSFTGTSDGVPMSVVTTGMGSASTGIVLPEAVRSGARVFVRVGSCGSLKAEADIGHSVICTGAVRLDGASENWAPIEYPAVADWRVVGALVDAAQELGLPHHVGIGATTTCFNEGQARPDDDGYVPPRLKERHDELVRRGVLFYSMEEATLFVWCSTHGGHSAGAIDAVYANRATNAFGTKGDEEAARIAILALRRLRLGA
jgi:uridine phosphorylase